MVVGPGIPEAKPPSLFVLAGEPSGDFHAALLGKEILRLCPQASLTGVGGPRMRQAGFRLVYDSSNWGAMGLSQAIPKIPGLLLVLHRLVASLKDSPPDLAILLDFGAFNLRFGPRLKALGIPVLYYFPPGSWNRQPANVEPLARACDVVVSPFPWSAQALRTKGIDAHFFGHPLLDVHASVSGGSANLRNPRLPSPNPTIGLFPGSRKHEIKHILPHLLSAAQEIGKRLPGARFVVSQVPNLNPSLFSSTLRSPQWRRLDIQLTSDTASLLKSSVLALAASGSITLEAALCGLPMVVVYRGSLAMWVQYRLFLRNLRYMAMPNILAGEAIVPELRQSEASGKRIAQAALNILLDPGVYSKMSQDLLRSTLPLQPRGAVEKTARLALEMARNPRPTLEKE